MLDQSQDQLSKSSNLALRDFTQLFFCPQFENRRSRSAEDFFANLRCLAIARIAALKRSHSEEKQSERGASVPSHTLPLNFIIYTVFYDCNCAPYCFDFGTQSILPVDVASHAAADASK